MYQDILKINEIFLALRFFYIHNQRQQIANIISKYIANIPVNDRHK